MGMGELLLMYKSIETLIKNTAQSVKQNIEPTLCDGWQKSYHATEKKNAKYDQKESMLKKI